MTEVRINNGLLALAHVLWLAGRLPVPPGGISGPLEYIVRHAWSERMNYLHELWFRTLIAERRT